MTNRPRRPGERLLDLLFPPKCAFCGRLLGPEEDGICTRCGAEDPDNPPVTSATVSVTLEAPSGWGYPSINDSFEVQTGQTYRLVFTGNDYANLNNVVKIAHLDTVIDDGCHHKGDDHLHYDLYHHRDGCKNRRSLELLDVRRKCLKHLCFSRPDSIRITSFP